MKPFLFVIVPAILGQPLDLSPAGISVPAGWHGQSLGQTIGYVVLLGAIGILMAIVGYKLSDKCLPGERHRESI